jgi:hypothetical protein
VEVIVDGPEGQDQSPRDLLVGHASGGGTGRSTAWIILTASALRPTCL